MLIDVYISITISVHTCWIFLY